ncbi:hypothetical protein TcBrA4_0072240 [Trypanosoma cruzi]|nr:hypothetical protein TcBrA4_0072240 [Trypanosoma cruzi]
MDYIKPASCLTTEFREKWGTFDWENTIAVNTDKTDLRDYVEFVMKETNMQLLEPYQDVGEEELQGLSPTDEDGGYGYVRVVLRPHCLWRGCASECVYREGCARQDQWRGTHSVPTRSSIRVYGIGEKLSLLDKEE